MKRMKKKVSEIKKTAETKAKLANGSSLSISLFIPLLHATINYYHFIYMRIVCN